MSAKWQIAQLNVATALYPVDDERMSGFVGQLDTVNALAEASPGFVWRLQSDSGNATDIQIEGHPELIPNMSVWTTVEDLFEFAYKSAHTEILADRRKWFQRLEGAYQVMWWIPEGHVPTLGEGMERLKMLQDDGPSPEAFTFKSRYPQPAMIAQVS